MANYIKIFDDTVLKQSILQGYQAQRTNVNLGSFTMGEMAFTRDTGRVFIGNETNQDNAADSKTVKGGILVGNKYLGMIDSKPLGHFSPNNFPLKYGMTNISTQQIDESNDGVTVEEQGVMLSGSIHRKDKNGGWSKDVDYIEKYDAYSGDYMFDIFNNALILFDKNITTEELTQPVYASSLNSKNEQEFLDTDGKVVDGKTVSRRTKIYDNSGERNKDYPIYGDGYVVMRILEPDGITLGYKDRAFTLQGTPRIDSTEESSAWENWSHNLLELKHVPSNVLSVSMSQDNFYDTGSQICLQPYQKNVNGFLGSKLVIPRSVTFANYFEDADYSDIYFTDAGTPIITDESTRTLTFDFFNSQVKAQQSMTDSVLSVDQNNSVSIKTPYRQSFTVALHDGLVNPITGQTSLVLSFDREQNKEIALGLVTPTKLIDDTKGSNDPFYTNSSSSYIYSGKQAFGTGGTLEYTEKWDKAYKQHASSEIDQFDSEYNMGINYLKKPIPICWAMMGGTSANTATAKLEYLIKPNLFCINKEYCIPTTVEEIVNEETGETTTIETIPTPTEYWGNSNAFNTAISVIGNNTEENKNNQSDFFVIDGYTCDYQMQNPFSDYSTTYVQNIMYTLPFYDIEQYNVSSVDDWTSSLLFNETDNCYYFQDVDVATSSQSALNTFYTANKPTSLERFYPTSITEYDSSRDYSLHPSLFAIMYDQNNGEYKAATRLQSSSNGNTISEPILNLSEMVTKDSVITKIEISTNDTDNRLMTVFDASDDNWTTNDTSNTSIDKVMIIQSNGNSIAYHVKRFDGDETIYFYALTNSQLFTSKDSIPYYMLVHFADGTTSTIKLSNAQEFGIERARILKYTDGGNSFFVMDGDQVFETDDTQPAGEKRGKQINELCSVSTSVYTIDENATLGQPEPVMKYQIQTELIGTFVENHGVIISTHTEGNYTVDTYEVTMKDVNTNISLDCDSVTFVSVKNSYRALDTAQKYLYKGSQNPLHKISTVEVQYKLGSQMPDSAVYPIRMVYNGVTYTSSPGENYQSKIRMKIEYVLSEDETSAEIKAITPCYISENDPMPLGELPDIGNVNVGDTITPPDGGNGYYYAWSTPTQCRNTLTHEDVEGVIFQQEYITVGNIFTKTYITKQAPTYKSGYVIPKEMTFDKGNRVVIPDNASSVICEVHNYNPTNATSPVTIYVADTTENLSNSHEAYTFPFALDTNGTPDIISETIKDTEKIIYSSNTSGVQLMEIPLQRYNLNKSKGFSIRLNNAPTDTQNKLVIRIIGYRV